MAPHERSGPDRRRARAGPGGPIDTGAPGAHPWLVHVEATSAAAALNSWWGYAEADATIVGLVVAAIVVLAAVFVLGRVFRRRGADSATGPGGDSRG